MSTQTIVADCLKEYLEANKNLIATLVECDCAFLPIKEGRPYFDKPFLESLSLVELRKLMIETFACLPASGLIDCLVALISKDIECKIWEEALDEVTEIVKSNFARLG